MGVAVVFAATVGALEGAIDIVGPTVSSTQTCLLLPFFLLCFVDFLLCALLFFDFDVLCSCLDFDFFLDDEPFNRR